MESPHFQSQHSEIILNVSADHASSDCSPRPKPSEPLEVAQSPINEASQSDSRVPESVERVEDSYQDSLPKRLRSEPAANQDDEEDLYGVSPQGRAILDATMASRKSAQEQPTALPKRNAIDAFLEVGAAFPSSEQNVITTSKGLAHANSAGDCVALGANDNVNVNDADALVTAQAHRTDNGRELQEDGTKDHISGLDHGQDQANEKNQAAARKRSSRDEQPKQALRNSKDKPLPLEQPARRIEVTEVDASGHIVNKGKANTAESQAHGQKHDHAVETKLSTGAELAERGKGVHDNAGVQKEDIGTSRPRRQAKQSALERLRAKNNKPDDEAPDNTASDPADDGSEFEVPGGNANQADKQLPTPITHGTVPKQAAGFGQDGKLKSVKPKHPAPATNAKQGQGKTTGRDDLAKSGVSVDKNTTVDQEGNARSAATVILTGPLTVRHEMQQTSREKSPPKRRGALKRPARAASRGRRPQVEDRYAFPERTPGRKRKSRSVSKASKASTVKPGPTRQRMQSESVKERLDHAESGPRHPSVPRQSHPEDSKTTVKDSRRTAAMRTKKPAQPPPTREPHGHRRDLTAASHQKPGSSQANAITIEQASDSSSSPRQRRTMQLEAKSQASNKQNDAVRPQTPAPVRSSPPGTVSAYTHVKEKPTIIAFGRHGPRNQGTASARGEPRSASSAKVFSGPFLSKESTPFERGRKTRLPSESPLRLSQPGLQSRKQTTTAAESNNVATDKENIFDAFTKNRKKKDLDNKLVPPAEADTGSGQEDQNSGFAILDDFDDATLVNENDSPAYSEVIKQPSASQLAMPPPKAVSKGEARLETVDASVNILKKEDKSVRAKDTPRPISTLQGVSAPLVKDGPVPKPEIPPVIPVDVTGRMSPAAAMKSATSTPKADFSEPQSVAQIGQGTRKRAQTVPQAESPSKKRKSPPRNVTHEVKKDPKPTHAKPLSIPGSKVFESGVLEPLKKGPERAREISEDRSTQTGDPVKRSYRRRNRAGRRTTQGSQCVDILGSPYPKDLDVPTKTTALETYSQQADLSPDHIAASSTALQRCLDLKAAPRMVPTLRPGLVSSNGKPIPAAPQESSKAMTRTASGPLAEQLLTARSADTSDNPFNTSSLVPRLNEPTVDRYKEALRQHGIILDEDRTSAEQQNEDEGLDDDTDMTLVEPVNDARKHNRRAPGSPVASESSSASTVDAATKVLEDVGNWRNSLKPHQTHLFDALVIAAHKLVRHMVDQETADRTIVADFRRRGEIIVTELQRAHANEYQQRAQSLQGLKKQAADELTAYGRKLKQVVRDVEKARAERKKAASASSEVDEMLKELVAGLEK